MPNKAKTFRPNPRAKKPSEAARGNRHDRGYTSRWDRARRAYLNAHPLCVDCQAQGRITAATCVDHVVPHRGNDELFWDEAGWASCCASCHSRRTVRFDGGFGRPRKPKPGVAAPPGV